MIRPLEIKDLTEINKWRATRDLVPLKEEELPRFGVIAPELAACMLVTTDSNCAFIEGLIANKEAPKDRRREALKEVIKACIDRAHALGFTEILFLSDHPSVTRWGNQFGFTFLKQYNLFKKGI